MSNSSLATEKYMAHSNNYSTGRSGRKIEKVTIHHMAGVLTAKQCGSIFQNGSRKASANYGVGKNGEIALFVDEANTSYADANWDSNCKSVTIETANNKTGGDWTVSDEVLNSLIKLVADILKRNNLGKAVKGKNVTWHSMYAATACPGNYLRRKMDYIVDEVNKILDGGTSTSKPSTPNKEETKKHIIDEDGLWGEDTTRKAQEVFGTTVDGIVADQYTTYKSQNPGLIAFEWKDKPSNYGSELIRAIQKKVGANVDGHIGPETIKKMQKWLGTVQDGYVSNPSDMVRAFQRWLNKQ